MKNLTDYEKMTGVEDDSVLALRMLYSSVTSDSHYSTFLNKMDPHLRSQIQPLDVLFFWQAAGRIAPGTHWMAIFAVDEVSICSVGPS